MSRQLIIFLLFLLAIIFVACSQSGKNEKSIEERIKEGESLFQSATCYQCHSMEGKVLYGPALDSILNTSVQVIRNKEKQTVLIDSVYIRRSITDPEHEKTFGFETRKMPVPTLKDEQIDALVDYLLFMNRKHD